MFEEAEISIGCGVAVSNSGMSTTWILMVGVVVRARSWGSE